MFIITQLESALETIGKQKLEIRELRKCKEALRSMMKCPLIIEAGFVPYIENVLGLRDNYMLRKKDD